MHSLAETQMRGDGGGQAPHREADKVLRARMVSLVEQVLNLHEDLPKSRTAPDKTAMQRRDSG